MALEKAAESGRGGLDGEEQGEGGTQVDKELQARDDIIRELQAKLDAMEASLHQHQRPEEELQIRQQFLEDDEVVETTAVVREGESKEIQSELGGKWSDEDTLHQQLRDLQRTLVEERQEREQLESEMVAREQQQRAEQRKHQAALLEKSNELGALRRQLADKPTTNGRLLKMTIDMMVLRHAKDKLEEELQSKDRQIEALRTVPGVAQALSISEGTAEQGELPQEGDGKVAAPGRAGRAEQQALVGDGIGSSGTAAAPSDEAARRAPPSLDELHHVYRENMRSLEAELGRVREELEQRQSEVWERSRECEELEERRGALAEEVADLRRQQQEFQQQLRSLEQLRAAVPGPMDPPNAASLIADLKYEVFELKKQLKVSAERGGGAVGSVQLQQHMQGLQGALERAEAGRQQLEAENSRMQQALVMAQRQREEMEQILQQTEDDLVKYYEDAERKIKQYWTEAQQCREDLKRSTEQEESLRRQLKDTQRASQLQVSKLHRAKRQGGQESAARVAQLEGAVAELQSEVEERRRGEAELQKKLQRQGTEGGSSRVNSTIVEGLRTELNRARLELQRLQELAEQERASRAQAEDLAGRRQAQIEDLQERLSTSYGQERESLVREMEAHQKTRLELEQEKEETLRQRRHIRELEEHKDSMNNIAIPDRRRSGHRLVLRPRKGGFNCRSCRGVKHGFMWKCQDRNCQDIFCTDCVAVGSAG